MEGVFEHLLEEAEGQMPGHTEEGGYQGAKDLILRRGVDVH